MERSWGSHLRRVTAVAATCAISLAFALTSLAANPETRADASGDALGGGADITSVVVSNDAAGTIAFRVTTPNHPTLQTTENIQLYIDSDQAQATGTNGYEFRISVFGGSPTPVSLDRWTSNGWEPAGAASFTGSFDQGLVASVARADLGGTSAFGYAVITIDGRTGELSDRAPEGALGQRWSYTLSDPVVDRDRDGVDDPVDACPTIAGGAFDSNENGCPGPYPAIAPVVSHNWRLRPTDGAFAFTRLQVRNAPPGSTIVLRGPGIVERLPAGSTSSRRLVGRWFRPGQPLQVTVTKRGSIGYVGRFAFRTKPGAGLHLVSRLCLRPTGSAVPVRCDRIDKGK